jgi:hypothetical protein
VSDPGSTLECSEEKRGTLVIQGGFYSSHPPGQRSSRKTTVLGQCSDGIVALQGEQPRAVPGQKRRGPLVRFWSGAETGRPGQAQKVPISVIRRTSLSADGRLSVTYFEPSSAPVGFVHPPRPSRGDHVHLGRLRIAAPVPQGFAGHVEVVGDGLGGDISVAYRDLGETRRPQRGPRASIGGGEPLGTRLTSDRAG